MFKSYIKLAEQAICGTLGFYFLVFHVEAQPIVIKTPIQDTTVGGACSPNIEIERGKGAHLSPPYLQLTSQFNKHRTLKWGSNANHGYNLGVNVVAGGNHTLEITLKDLGENCNWDAIYLLPNASDSLLLAPYIREAGGLGRDWTTISIPLSDFQRVDWTSLAFLELHYCAHTENINLAISEIKFEGGIHPFIWLPNNKTPILPDSVEGPGPLKVHTILSNDRADYCCNLHFSIHQPNENPSTSSVRPLLHNSQNSAAKRLSTTFSIGNKGPSEPESLANNLENYSEVVSPLNVTITSPPNNTQYYFPTDLTIEASVSGEILPGPDYLKVVNSQTGFRKLKLGYTPGNIYGPGQNVVAGGNHTLEIVLKDFLNTADWSKIRIRPAGIGTLTLASYIASAQDVGNGWKKIAIPLSHFDPSINFSSLNHFEFPYSANAPAFELGIASMKFTGGSIPFIWFGEGKTNNPHDGNNGPGQLFATLMSGNAGPIVAQKVLFYDQEVCIGVDSTRPFACFYPNVSPGMHRIIAKVYDNQGAIKVSDTTKIWIVDAPPPGSLVLTITFDALPTYATITKAPLRYNKDFAYSLTLDDGYRCAYKHAFMLLNGGYVAGNNTHYPGLFYTDGCGNQIPFKGGLAIYSLGASGNDLHVNSNNYINWNELQTMIAAGWNVFNHSLQHAAGTGTNYLYQINENTRYIRQKTGYVTRHFVVPSGDQNYVTPAFASGMHTVIGNNAAYQGFPHGLMISNPLSYNQFTLYKRFLYDTYYDTTNIFLPLQNAANLSVNGNHSWYCDFTHRVDFGSYAGSLNFPLFAWYMKWIERNYGQSGADNIWMAPIQDVYEYLYVRDHTPLTISRSGQVMRVIIDRSQLPDSLLTYALSFVIQSDANISSVLVSQPALVTWRGNTPVKLINIEWNNNLLKNTTTSQEILATDAISPRHAPDSTALYVVNPASDLLHILFEKELKIKALEIYNFSGKKIKSLDINTSSSTVFADISFLQPGMYLLLIQLHDGTYFYRKFLKSE